MAVTLPSDLVADVMRNADPARRTAAATRLQSMGNGTAFATAVDAAAPAAASSGRQGSFALAGRDVSATVRKDDDAKSAGFRGFEQMVLRNLFESMLPAEDSGSFGTGPSAGVWRSMAADQLANVYADNGGAGIARMLAEKAPEQVPRPERQWPYFTLNPLRAPGAAG